MIRKKGTRTPPWLWIGDDLNKFLSIHPLLMYTPDAGTFARAYARANARADATAGAPVFVFLFF